MEQTKRKEIYSHTMPWPVYSMAWSVRKDKPFRLAVGSFLESYTNKVNVIQLNDAKVKKTKTKSIN